MRNDINKSINALNSSSLKKTCIEELYHSTIIRNYLSIMLSSLGPKDQKTDAKIVDELSHALDITKALFLSIITMLLPYEAFIFYTSEKTEIAIGLIIASLMTLICSIVFMKEKLKEYFTYILLMVVIVPVTIKILENFKVIFSNTDSLVIGLETFLYFIILFLIPSIYHKLSEKYLLRIKIKRISKIYNKYKSRFNEVSPENIDINI